jgi:hypothetical protein
MQRRRSASVADAVALVLIASSVTAGCFQLLAMRDSLAIVVFVSTWLLGAVTRVSALRRGQYQPLRITRNNGQAMGLMIAAGTLPWFAVAWLRAAYPWVPLWEPVKFPLVVTACGIALAVVAFAKPCIQRIGTCRPGSREFSLLVDGLVPASAIFLVSGSPFVGFVSCLWLALLLRKETGVTAFMAEQAIEPRPVPRVAITAQPALLPAT